jgi:hypothetical protein
VKYLWPAKEDVVRFDFEIDPEDEDMCSWIAKAHLEGMASSVATENRDAEQRKRERYDC